MARKERDDSQDLLDHELMKLLSHWLRTRVLAIMIERVASPSEVATELDQSLSDVNYHVGRLSERGAIALEGTEPKRGAVEHFYRAVEPTLLPDDAWDGLTPAMRRRVSTCILREFFDDAIASLAAGVFDDRPGELSLTPLIVDEPGVEELGRLSRGLLDAVLELQADADVRIREGGEGVRRISASLFLASFLSARDVEQGRRASARLRR